MEWRPHARRLADAVTDRVSRWNEPIATTPRHVFVPRWWDGYVLRDGPSDEAEWLRVAYGDASIVTAVGGLHADHAEVGQQPAQHPAGSRRSTSSSTLPSLVVRMYRHARLYRGADILDVGTGSGYGAALLAQRFGGEHVTSIDVDPYLTRAATERLDRVGLRPTIVTGDATATDELPGTYDRIVAMVGMPGVPAAWMAALRPGGRLVTTLANTTVIITATKAADGCAYGRVEWDRAGFMGARSAADYPVAGDKMFASIEHAGGQRVTGGSYPVLHLAECWELQSVLEVTAPGIEHYYEEGDDGTRTAWMVHADGSWARATAHGTERPVVHQGGPRNLWDTLDDIRDRWLREGQLPLYGATAFIDPGGMIHLARDDWHATITAPTYGSYPT